MNFSLWYWNIEGLRNKLTDNTVLQNLSKHDVIGLSETWLTDSATIIPPPKYDIKTKNRPLDKRWRSDRGGLMYLFKTSLSPYLSFPDSNYVLIAFFLN